MPFFLHGGLITRARRHSRELVLAGAFVEGSLRLRLGGSRQRRDPERLRVLAYTTTYLPERRGGSEVTLHRLLQQLGARGHDVQVLVEDAPRSTLVDGIEVHAASDRTQVRELFEWSDVVVAQL